MPQSCVERLQRLFREAPRPESLSTSNHFHERHEILGSASPGRFHVQGRGERDAGRACLSLESCRSSGSPRPLRPTGLTRKNSDIDESTVWCACVENDFIIPRTAKETSSSLVELKLRRKKRRADENVGGKGDSATPSAGNGGGPAPPTTPVLPSQFGGGDTNSAGDGGSVGQAQSLSNPDGSGSSATEQSSADPAATGATPTSTPSDAIKGLNFTDNLS
ncbi:unnamed protein product, partial [Nesidiocoris tenuis]